MSGTPWIKFYPRDWRGDQALRAVSIAARGFWMECLCIMHEATPYGHLLLNGRPVEGDTLARMAGVSVDEVSTYVSELREAGVLSVTREGVIFSRRMVSDHARAQKGRKAIQKRWHQAPENIEETGQPNRSPNRDPTTQKPDTRVQKERKKVRGAADAAPLTVVSGGLAFTGQVIRLDHEQFDRWRKSYQHIPDLVAALEKADAFYADNPPKDGKWFFPVARWLEKENGEWLADGEKRRRANDIRSF